VDVIKQLIIRLQKELSSQFVRNLGWLGLAEIIYRIFRLGVVVIFSRFLTRRDYGLGAILFTVRDYALTFTNVGIGAKIIQADEEELDALCDSAYWLNWVVFTALFVIQTTLAFPVAWLTKSPEIVLPIVVAGIPYLIWPIVGVQKTLLQRENKFKVIALTDSLQFCVASVISAIFAVSGMGFWVFVLPGVLVAPLELIVYLNQHPWRPKSKFTTENWDKIFIFGRNIFGVGLLRTSINNLDNIIIASFLGVESLGNYSWAFNSGLGISLSIIKAINSAILPHLCAVSSELDALKQRYFKSLKTISILILPLVLLQATLAPFYIPIIFGQQWANAVPLYILICLSAIPRPFGDASSQLLVAIGRPDLDLRWNGIFTVLFATCLVIGVRWRDIGVATAVLGAHAIFIPVFVVVATGYVFRQVGNRGVRE
jgi:teichuronic acid exporter